MKIRLMNNDGYAMVLAMIFLTALALLAGIIISVSTSEKKTAFNEYTYSRAFYSADAGGEAAVNWLRLSNTPPGFLDAQKNVFIPAGYDTLSSDHLYKHEIKFIGTRARYGWDPTQYLDFEYSIDSQGASVAEAESELELRALRLFKLGY